VPLPATGPTSRDQVRTHLALPAGDVRDNDRIDLLVLAVNARVREWPVADKSLKETQEDADLAGWPQHVTQGATMLVARLLWRKDSPGGVAAVNDFGPLYVQRNDPDIAMLLELGDWASPAAG
jgi:hypothetical protein